jgi:hypothetical protein
MSILDTACWAPGRSLQYQTGDGSKSAAGTPSPAGSMCYVITRVFSRATRLGCGRGGGGDGSSHFAVNLPTIVCAASAFICCRGLPLCHSRGLCNKASRTNKGIPHAYLVERRGGLNGNLTYPLTLVILRTNSYFPFFPTHTHQFFMSCSSVLDSNEGCIYALIGHGFCGPLPESWYVIACAWSVYVGLFRYLESCLEFSAFRITYNTVLFDLFK